MRTPRQNRVLPTGEIVATDARGLMLGNRGILHDAAGQLGTSRWKHPHWVCCQLAFRGRRREIMAPGAYTELFFLDEAVALAAGHRPCAECRRDAYNAFRAAWAEAFGQTPGAPEIDRALHRDRVNRTRQQCRHDARAGDLPEGCFILSQDGPMLLAGDRARPFEPTGYGPPRALDPASIVTVLTPRATVAVLRSGYRPILHPAASV